MMRIGSETVPAATSLPKRPRGASNRGTLPKHQEMILSPAVSRRGFR